MLLESLRKKVIEIAQKAQAEKLIPLTMGNFSAKDKTTGLIAVTPSGMPYETLIPEDIVIVDAAGKIIDGIRKPSIETPLHCAVYRKRLDIGGIAHTHSTFATAWAACHKPVPVVVAKLASFIGGPVECAPYRPMGSEELALTVADSLKDRHAVLMANHGLLAAGPDLDTAFNNAVIVEEGAKIAYFAMPLEQVKYISEEECTVLRAIALAKYGQ